MSDQDCPTPKKHSRHLCTLKQKGREKKIAARGNAPTAECAKCGALANRPEDLCHPTTI